MEKEFIPYEEALALKELGFDEICIAYFNGKIITRIGDYSTKSIDKINTWRNTFLSYDGGKSCVPNEEDFKEDLLANPEKYSRHKWGMTISAPLYQQAFRWFREKYNLYAIPVPNSFNLLKWKYRIESLDKSIILEHGCDQAYWIMGGFCDTPEEAELACLRKLIEIVKVSKGTPLEPI